MTSRVISWFTRMKNWRLSRGEQSQNICMGDYSREDNLVRALGHFEPYVMKVQSVLMWENPVISAISIVIINILFGLAVSFEIRFYGLLFSAMLCVFILDLCMEKVWPGTPATHPSTSVAPSVVHPRFLTVPEIGRYLSQAREVVKDYYVWLKNLRDDQPGTFCCAMCLLFALLTFIGRTVPGAVLGYCLMMLVMTGPGICIHLLPPSIKLRVSNFQAALHSKEKGYFADMWKRWLCMIQCSLTGEMDSEVEEYLPEQSCETLALLQQATEPMDEEHRDESLIVEEFGLDLDLADANILAHEDGSTDGLDMSEFDLSSPPSLGGSTTNNNTNNHNAPTSQEVSRERPRKRHDLTIDDSDDSDEDVGDGIHFQSHHFNQDSSEEEEQGFVQGLVFPEPVSSVAATAATINSDTAESNMVPSLGEMLTTSAVNVVSKNISNLAALHSSLISSVISAAVEKVSTQSLQQNEPSAKGSKISRNISRDDSSSSGGESEFEMISHNDLT